MKPILYAHDETAFTSAGLAILSDAIECTVSEELNGTYELTMIYPIIGRHYDLIQEGLIIGATHDDSGKLQPFEIYGRSAPINGNVTFNAHHISYRLSNCVVMPFTASSAADAFYEIEANAVGTLEFSFETDKTQSGELTISEPTAIRAALGGADNTILKAFDGGDYEFDMFDVILHTQRGENTNVEIRYGKNLTDLTHEINASGAYNAIVPFWKDSSAIVTLPEVYIAHDLDAELVMIPKDFSDQFQAKPSEAELRAKAQAFLDSSYSWVPAETITVNFIQLWQTDEYKNYAELQRVKMGDKVRVYYPALGVIANHQKVVKTVYNTLLDRYDEITLNELKDTLGSITDQKIEDNTTALIQGSVNLALSAIQGGLGGYIAIPFDEMGRPAALYVLDQPNLQDAQKVIRFNESGMMRSSTGINGTYSSLITMSGTITGVNLTKKTGTVTLDTSGIGTVTSLVNSGYMPVFGYIDNEEAFVTFARDASGGFKIKCVDATGAPITGSKSLTICSKK